MFSKRTVGKIKWLYFFTGIRRLQPSCQFVVARGVAASRVLCSSAKELKRVGCVIRLQ